MRSKKSVRWISLAAVLIFGVASEKTSAQNSEIPRCESMPAGVTGEFTTFPAFDVFCPLAADPKQPHSFISYVRGTTGAFDTDVAAIGIGEHFGLARWGSLQLSVSAGIFAQFDLRSASYDLINADYVIGVPVTYRRSNFSARLRLYHQSSHLGDELLLRNPPPNFERENLSFESLELILSQELAILRVYGGGEVLFNREPAHMESTLLHGGVEAYSPRFLFSVGRLGGARLIAAVDAKAPAEQEWTPAVSVRAGLEFGRTEAPQPSRRGSIVGEYYTGPSPYGQFFAEQVTYYGVGIHLSL